MRSAGLRLITSVAETGMTAKTTARSVEGGVVVSRTKSFNTNSGGAGMALVSCQLQGDQTTRHQVSVDLSHSAVRLHDDWDTPRHLDEASTTDAVPAHSIDRVENPHAGEVVDIEIDLFPIGMVCYPGEQLVSSRNALGPIMPGTRDYLPHNAAKHIIHTGGNRSSYLQLPVANA